MTIQEAPATADWRHAERLTRLLEAAVMNSEEFTCKTSQALAYIYDMDGEEVEDKDLTILRLTEEASAHLSARSLAMSELKRIFELYDRLQLILERPDILIQGELHRQMIAVTLARIDERLRCEACRS